MPNPANKHPQNASGPWYVDLNCISCDTCTDISPEIFGRDAERKAFVREHRPAEVSLFQFAVESCPVEAVGEE
ncbi:MAG: ferredoxin [Myxococcales bacterium]|nr:ferredoxin [Myxococcales bacterium]